MLHPWQNFGDMSPEHGQTWLSGDSGDDWAAIVEVIHGPELGLPENQFHITRGTVYFSPDRGSAALESCDSGIYGPPEFLTVAYAFNAYGGADPDMYGGAETVRLGIALESDDPEPGVTLHGNAKLSLYLENEYLT